MMAKIVPGLVSIVMPAFNGENFIRQAIDSVLSQTYSNWELIIVDDGSTDHTAEIVRGYETDSRIRSVYQENRGQAAALNHGLGLACGEYVTTLDTDDWYTSNSLQDRVTYLENHPEFGAVYGDGIYCDVDGKVLKRFSEFRIGNVTGDVYDTLITSPFFGTGANVTIRREIIEESQIRYDDNIFWCQDLDFYIRVAEKCSFGLVDSLLVWYRIHKTNMTMSAGNSRRIESLIRTKNKVLMSPRFEKVGTSYKISFFSQFLRNDLIWHLEAQENIVNGRVFQSLPERNQGKIMGSVANQYLLLGKNIDFAKDWLTRAWHLDPFNLKTIVGLVLVYLNPRVVRTVLGWLDRRKRLEIVENSPFENI